MAMRIDVSQEDEPDLAGYATIPIAFEVRTVARVSPTELGTPLVVDAIAVPYIKDYDAADNGPLTWATRFDLRHWTFFIAHANGKRVGGAAVVYRAPDIDMLDSRRDVALLWDIRVAPEHRGQGVGTALLADVEAWARENDATWLEVETQDINVPACRCYARHGFELRSVDPDVYADLPNETQLLWSKRLR